MQGSAKDVTRKRYPQIPIAFLPVIFSLPVVIASDADWVVLEVNASTKTAIDEASVVSIGNLRKARNAQFNDDGSVVLVYQQYNCERRQVRITQFFERAPSGVTSEIPLGKSGDQWLPIPPNSTLERLFDFVCSRQL